MLITKEERRENFLSGFCIIVVVVMSAVVCRVAWGVVGKEREEEECRSGDGRGECLGSGVGGRRGEKESTSLVDRIGKNRPNRVRFAEILIILILSSGMNVEGSENEEVKRGERERKGVVRETTSA